jgi:hypothetical protein
MCLHPTFIPPRNHTAMRTLCRRSR